MENINIITTSNLINNLNINEPSNIVVQLSAEERRLDLQHATNRVDNLYTLYSIENHVLENTLTRINQRICLVAALDQLRTSLIDSNKVCEKLTMNVMLQSSHNQTHLERFELILQRNNAINIPNIDLFGVEKEHIADIFINEDDNSKKVEVMTDLIHRILHSTVEEVEHYKTLVDRIESTMVDLNRAKEEASTIIRVNMKKNDIENIIDDNHLKIMVNEPVFTLEQRNSMDEDQEYLINRHLHNRVNHHMSYNHILRTPSLNNLMMTINHNNSRYLLREIQAGYNALYTSIINSVDEQNIIIEVSHILKMIEGSPVIDTIFDTVVAMYYRLNSKYPERFPPIVLERERCHIDLREIIREAYDNYRTIENEIEVQRSSLRKLEAEYENTIDIYKQNEDSIKQLFNRLTTFYNIHP